MPWFKVDDGLSDNVKTRRAGTEAIGLWALAGSWSSRELTDGFVPKSIARRWDPRSKLARKLVEAGFWEDAEKGGEQGYQFINWSEYQPSKAEVEAERAAAAKRMRAARERRKKASTEGARSPERSPEHAPNVRPNTRRTFADTSGEVREKFAFPDPTRPDPLTNYVEGGSHVPNARATELPPASCREHAIAEPDCTACAVASGDRETALQAMLAAAEPAPFCARHPGGTPTPCRDCRAMREIHDRWLHDRAAATAERDRAAAAAQSAAARQSAEVRAQAIENCRLGCGRGTNPGYLDGRLCDHDPDSADRRARGMAKIRAAIDEKAARKVARTTEPDDAPSGEPTDRRADARDRTATQVQS